MEGSSAGRSEEEEEEEEETLGWSLSMQENDVKRQALLGPSRDLSRSEQRGARHAAYLRTVTCGYLPLPVASSVASCRRRPPR